MSDDDRIRWARALVVASWLFVATYLTFLITQIRRAAAVSDTRFEDGDWGARVEQISFASRPEFVVSIIAATAATLVGVALTRNVVDPVLLQLRTLVRLIGGICVIIVIMGAVGIIALFFRNPDSVSDLGYLLSRTGGILTAVACMRLCTEVERTGA